MFKAAIIIPCYNEEVSVAAVIREIRSLPPSDEYRLVPVIVNDCSSDNTKKVAETLRCTYLDLPVNLGIGGAVQTGFRYAHANGFDFAIQLDGDGQHPAGEIPFLIAPLLKNTSDVVIGSRFLKKGGFRSTWLRRMGIGYFKLLNRIFTGILIADSTSGFRAINRAALAVVSRDYPDEYPEPAAIVQYAIHKLRIIEIPVIMRPRLGGISSIRPSHQLYYMVKVTLSIFFLYIKLTFYGKRSAL